MATGKLLEPIAGSNIQMGSQNAGIEISPDGRWIAAAGADQVMTVYPADKGEPIRISSLQAAFSPFPAGWTSAGELWVALPGATPPRLVRVELATGKTARSIDIDLRQLGAQNITDARITPDESLLAIEYEVWRGRLELVRGIPADR